MVGWVTKYILVLQIVQNEISKLEPCPRRRHHNGAHNLLPLVEEDHVGRLSKLLHLRGNNNTIQHLQYHPLETHVTSLQYVPRSSALRGAQSRSRTPAGAGMLGAGTECGAERAAPHAPLAACSAVEEIMTTDQSI